MLNSMQTKSVAKDIVRSMEMNGTLKTQPARQKPIEDMEEEEEEDEEEEEEDLVIREVGKGNKAPYF